MKRAVAKNELESLYVEEDLSDSQIARLLGIHRTYVSKLRKEYDIQTNHRSSATGRIAEVYTILTLLNKGFSVRDMNSTDKVHPFDILVDGEIKVDVKSARLTTDDSYKFTFVNSKDKQVKIDESVIVTNAGGTLKKYHKSCDYVVLVALNEEKTESFVIPSVHHLLRGKQTVSITDLYNNRFNKYRNNWEQLRSGKSATVL